MNHKMHVSDRMKNMIAVFAFALLATGAQASVVSLGAYGGVNLTSLGGDTVESTVEDKLTFGAGAYVNLSLLASVPALSFLSLQSEVFFTSRGFKAPVPGIDTNTNLTYLEFPILAKFSLPIGLSKTGVYALAGVHLGLLTGTTTVATGELATEADLSDIFNSFSLSYTIGGGFSQQLLPALDLFIEARFVKATSTIVDIESSNALHQNVYIFLGIDFDL